MNRRAFFLASGAAAMQPLAPSTPRWVRQPFAVLGSGGKRIEDGITCGTFGVRMCGYIADYDEWDVDEQENPPEHRQWNVTHLPTGYAMPCLFQSEPEAMRAAEQWLRLADWSKVDGNKHPDIPRLKTIFNKWREEHDA